MGGTCGQIPLLWARARATEAFLEFEHSLVNISGQEFHPLLAFDTPCTGLIGIPDLNLDAVELGNFSLGTKDHHE